MHQEVRSDGLNVEKNGRLCEQDSATEESVRIFRRNKRTIVQRLQLLMVPRPSTPRMSCFLACFYRPATVFCLLSFPGFPSPFFATRPRASVCVTCGHLERVFDCLKIRLLGSKNYAASYRYDALCCYIDESARAEEASSSATRDSNCRIGRI